MLFFTIKGRFFPRGMESREVEVSKGEAKAAFAGENRALWGSGDSVAGTVNLKERRERVVEGREWPSIGDIAR